MAPQLSSLARLSDANGWMSRHIYEYTNVEISKVLGILVTEEIFFIVDERNVSTQICKMYS